jgi:hypothetical protein
VEECGGEDDEEKSDCENLSKCEIDFRGSRGISYKGQGDDSLQSSRHSGGLSCSFVRKEVRVGAGGWTIDKYLRGWALCLEMVFRRL